MSCSRQIYVEPSGKSAVCGLNGLRPTLRVGTFKILDRVPRSCSYGLFPWAALLRFAFGQKIWHTIFFSSDLQNIPEAAPKASRSFSVSEKLACYGSSALSGVEHLRLLVGKDSIADALLRHFGSLKALSRASFTELRQFLPKGKAEAVMAAFSMSNVADAEDALSAPLNNPEAIYRANLDMQGFHQEVVRVVLLDARHHCITKVDVARGTVNESLAHPREILKASHCSFRVRLRARTQPLIQQNKPF